MKFDELIIDGDMLILNFVYENKNFNFVQAKNPVTASNSVVSDRRVYEEIYNGWIDESITYGKK